MKKIKDVIIYQDARFYSSFPSLVVRPNGEILCAFRRAPDRRALWGSGQITHTDPNSYLVLVRSSDSGQTWTSEPELIFAHPMGGSQDPCMVQLHDGSIICTSYGWALLPKERLEKISTTTTLTHSPFAFLGGYVLRSDNGGKSWQGPWLPPVLPEDQSLDAFDKPCPTYNRGAAVECRNGRLLWAVVRNEQAKPRESTVHLIESADRGTSWKYVCPVASDEKVSFNETSLIETPKGDIVAFMRTEGLGGNAAIARSTDGGKSFQPWQNAGFFGHPFHAVKLPDGRILLVYGYRAKPFGIRARVLDAEATNVTTAQEIVLRDDGGHGDLGYPWAAVLPDGKVLVAYYFNINDGTRHIAASILDTTSGAQ